MTTPPDQPDPAEQTSSTPKPRRDPRLEIPEVLRQPAPITRKFHRSRARRAVQASDTARAFGIASEFIFSTMGGLFLGWLADRLLGTKPWGTMIGLTLGFVGGMVRVIKATNRMDRENRKTDRLDRS